MTNIMILAVKFCDRLAANGTPIDAALAFATHRYGLKEDELRALWITKLLEITQIG